MVRKPYKGNKKGAGRFVQLTEWLQESEAWATLKPGPRALYIEIKRRFNGVNNGRIILSHRNTVGPWFRDLEERGFIRMTQAPHLGPSGVGMTSHWALEEEPTDDLRPATKRFMAWRQEQKPRTENRPVRHIKQAPDGQAGAIQPRTVLKIVT